MKALANTALAIAIGLMLAAALVAWGMEPPVAVEMTADEKKAELRKQRWERAVEASFKEGVK